MRVLVTGGTGFVGQHLIRALIERGDECVVISRGGKPVARLVPIRRRQTPPLGRDRGRFEIPADFDDPLPEAILAEFEA